MIIFNVVFLVTIYQNLFKIFLFNFIYRNGILDKSAECDNKTLRALWLKKAPFYNFIIQNLLKVV